MYVYMSKNKRANEIFIMLLFETVHRQVSSLRKYTQECTFLKYISETIIFCPLPTRRPWHPPRPQIIRQHLDF